MWLTEVVAIGLAAAGAVNARPSESFDLLKALNKRQAQQSFNSDYNGPILESPPSYPSPWASGAGDWAAAHGKAAAFVSQLTLAEKVNLTTGTGWLSDWCVGNVGAIPRLGFHSLCMQDGPLGIRFADYVSAFPVGINVAATWNRDLARERGAAIGAEAAGKGIDVLLGPAIGPLGRFPTGGRNWEGFSPEPYLAGAIVAPTVQGIQSSGVVATTKHYIANEQEHFRQTGESQDRGYNISETLSSNIDDKTMHEIYLWPFADAVRAGTGSIMCSYQQINNSYGCANSYTLNHLLKNELGFQGFIMSDWQAQHNGMGTLFAGLDMSMPGDTVFNSGATYWGTNLTVGVLNGTVPQYRLDDAAIRIMTAYYYVGHDDVYVPTNFDSWSYETFDNQHPGDKNSAITLVNQHVNVQDDHRSVIRRIGQQSSVLLKNTNGALPLSGSEKQVGVFGYDACSNPAGPNGCDNQGCNNGTLAMAYGSGTSSFPYLVTPQEAIENYIVSNGDGNVQTICQNNADSLIKKLATTADTALVFVNANAGEGFITIDGNVGDRNNLSVWENGDRLIENVTTYNNNTIVVIHSVGAVNVTGWYENPNVTAIIWAGVPGQETGNAIVDVLYGAVNPGGKLPFTIARNREDYGADVIYEPNNGQFGAPQDDFSTTGVFIDYRHFDQNNIEPIYEFGFGLSYTTFEFSNLVITAGNPAPYVPGGGLTQPAPTYGTVSSNVDEVLFPKDTIDYRVYNYIYPYLNGSDLETAANDDNYGEPSENYLPAGFNDDAPQPILPAGGAPGGNPGLWEIVATVEATVTNTGSVEGDEVAQLYIGLGDGEPPKVLRGFERLTIPAGGSAIFTADLTRKDVSVWDVVSQNWVEVENPKIYVGDSSRNTPLEGTLTGGSTGGGSGGHPGYPGHGNETIPYPPTYPGTQTSFGPTGGATVTQISDGQPQVPTQT